MIPQFFLIFVILKIQQQKEIQEEVWHLGNKCSMNNGISSKHVCVLSVVKRVLRLKLVDGRCQVQFPLALAIWSFPSFFHLERSTRITFPPLTQVSHVDNWPYPHNQPSAVVLIRNSRKYGLHPLERPHGGHSTYGLRSPVWQLHLNLQPTNLSNMFVLQS